LAGWAECVAGTDRQVGTRLELPMRNPRSVVVALAVALGAACLIAAAPAHAGPSPAAKCQAAKLKAAGKGCECRNAAAAKAVLSGLPADFTKCAAKLSDAFAKAEAKGGCPATGEGGTVDGRLVTLVGDLSTALQTGTATGAGVKCAAEKLKAAGKKCGCVHKLQATAATKGTTPDFTVCDTKLDAAYVKAEAKAGGACATIGDADEICDAVKAEFGEIEADIADRDTAFYSALGPYGVGLRTVTYVDSSRPTPPNGVYAGAPDRTLVTDIWYPTAPDPNLAQQQLNAPIAPTGGRFPLIVRAHGFSGLRNDSKYMMRQLASWGYIVVTPDFPLSNLNAPGGPTIDDIGNQAGDLSFLIDTMIAEDANAMSFLHDRVDATRIGAQGHSLGGATVLLATFHPTLRDPRIDATIALSPLACVFVDGFFDTATTPLMIQGGTVDMITEYTSNDLNPFAFVQAPKYLVTYDGGTHLGFSDRLLFGPSENGDDAIGCSIFVGPGDPRPVPFSSDLPSDFLGGLAVGIDPSGAVCGPLCPLPPPSYMLHARQNTLAKAASISFFEAKLRGSISGHRMITGRIDTDNADTTLLFAE
jgi:dienelactone hydrolase